jgi:hypothetical protein
MLSPYKKKATAVAMEYIALVRGGFIEDDNPVETVRRLFSKHGGGNGPDNLPLLDPGTIGNWRTKTPPTGRLRRRIERAEREGVLGGRSKIARTLLEEYVIGVFAKRTGI